MIKFFRKYHKWLGIIFAFIILSYVFSGIILNHRNALAGVDINRKLLPEVYRYNNWNNSAVKATLRISPDSVLLYGNIGIWLTDSAFSTFTGFRNGFPKGIDNHRVFQLVRTKEGKLLAGAFSGLFSYSFDEGKWTSVDIPVRDKRVVDIAEKNDTLLFLTRSFLLRSVDLKEFDVMQLPPPENYDNKTGLFKTLWVIHSGEIYGLTGKLIIDFAGLVFAFLTISGLIVFINKIVLKKEGVRAERRKKLKSSNRWNLRWHNKLGWIMLAILILNTVTGMFLRPPLLAFIGNSRVGKIPFTELADSNPWFDQLRRIFHDEESGRYILSTSEGFFHSDDDFSSPLKKYVHQPPASIMGVTVLEKVRSDTYLVGSFEGLFLWNSQNGRVFDYITKQEYESNSGFGSPVGDFLISGFTRDFKGQEFWFDYNRGALPVSGFGDFAPMPQQLRDESTMSLWNLALEIHTGRIWQPLIGGFYILIVPLTGLIVLFILISGFIVWLKLRRTGPSDDTDT